jgi:uncharacterized cupredoxin-like copper-binding protein
MRGKRVVLIAVVVVAAVWLMWLIGLRPAVGPPAVPAQEIEVLMSDFRFEPVTIEVSRGKVKFKLKNTGVVEHDFVIPELGLGTPPIPAGGEMVLELDIKAQPGRYRIECHVPGHREAGMVGTLVVKP